MGTLKSSLSGVMMGVMLAAVVAAADGPPPDVEFLEFLGTWDKEQSDWNDFFDSLPDPAEQATGGNIDKETSDDAR